MKKLILLALVALVAGAAFASTDPAFSGNFEYRTQFNFTDKVADADDAEGEAKINLNGVVDEWSTVNAEITASGAGGQLDLNQFTLTTDVTGALGVDGAVGFSITWGAVTHQAAKYYDKAGYGDGTVAVETSSTLGASLVFTIVEKVKFIALLTPMTYLDDATWTAPGWTKPVMGFELQFLQVVEGLDFNIWYTDDQNVAAPGGNDAPAQNFGIGAGYGSDMFDAGFVFVGNLMGTAVYGAGVTAKYKMDVFDFGAAFFSTDFSDFSNASSVGINATWKAVTDTLDVFVAVKIPFANFSDSFGVDGGVKFYLGAVTYVLGYDYQNAAFEGPDLVNNGGLNNSGGAYLKVKADY